MIKSKDDLKRYLHQDALALREVDRKRPKLIGNKIWKYQRLLRKCEYYQSFGKVKKMFFAPKIVWDRLRFNRLQYQLGFTIPLGVFDEGLSIAHRGSIVVGGGARIGKNCRIHENVTIGGSGGTDAAAKIGDNVFIGPGARIIGDVTIADDVGIAPNTVVVKSITEAGTTWGGIPAKKISDNGSRDNLSPYLFEK